MEYKIKSFSRDIGKVGLQFVFITITVCLTKIKAEDCGHEELAACAKPLQVLSATSELSFVTKKEELDKLCPDLHSGLHCIRSYTRRCMSMNQRDHFNKLYHGTNQMIHDLCEKGQYQEDFLRHAPCMRHIKREYEICAQKYQSIMSKIGQKITSSSIMETQQKQNQHKSVQQQNLTKALSDDEDRIKTVCCAFQNYIKCSERIVREACGDETAEFTKRFLDKMSNSLMRMHCEGYGPETGKCDEPFISGSPSHSAALALVTISLIVRNVVLHWQ